MSIKLICFSSESQVIHRNLVKRVSRFELRKASGRSHSEIFGPTSLAPFATREASHGMSACLAKHLTRVTNLLSPSFLPDRRLRRARCIGRRLREPIWRRNIRT